MRLHDGTRHNLGAYEAAGLEWHHVPVESAHRGAEALEEMLPLLRRELRRRGAVAVHGDRHTDFVAAVCAAHLHEARGVDPAEALARAAGAGLTVNGYRRARCSGCSRRRWICGCAARRRSRSASVSVTATGAGSNPFSASRGRAAAQHQGRVELGGGRGGQVGVHPVAHHQRPAVAEPVERGEQQLRLRLAHDLRRALARHLDRREDRAGAGPEAVGLRVGGVARGGEEVGAAAHGERGRIAQVVVDRGPRCRRPPRPRRARRGRSR